MKLELTNFSHSIGPLHRPILSITRKVTTTYKYYKSENESNALGKVAELCIMGNTLNDLPGDHPSNAYRGAKQSEEGSKKRIAKRRAAEAPCINRNTIYLSTPVNALVEGIYEENIALAEVKQHGDFGLGTFNDLDGEMMMLDGVTYQINSEGRVNIIGDEALTPFACVTFYRPVSREEIVGEMDYDAFIKMLYSLLPSTNLFYAIRIEGMFAHIKTRSVPRQENYRPIVEVTRDQPTFDFYDIEGTVAGFFTPSFMASLNVPGLHQHFLSSELKHGGHLLECSPTNVQIGIQFIDRLELSLPMTLDYLTSDFTRDAKKDLDRAEN